MVIFAALTAGDARSGSLTPGERDIRCLNDNKNFIAGFKFHLLDGTRCNHRGDLANLGLTMTSLKILSETMLWIVPGS